MLVLLAAVQFIGGGILYVAGDIPDTATLVSTFGTGLLFAGLAVWARKDPLSAVLVGLGLWIASVVVAAVVEPASR